MLTVKEVGGVGSTEATHNGSWIWAGVRRGMHKDNITLSGGKRPYFVQAIDGRRIEGLPCG
jgi:hypothetical protein